MAALSWFANSGTLSITATSGASPVTIAALQDIEISPTFEHVDLYGMESILLLERCKHSAKINITCKYAMWDPSADYIMWSVLNGAFTTSSTTGINDGAANRNREAKFGMTMTLKDTTTGASTLTITATNVMFEDIPFKLTQNEFVVRDLKGIATNASFTYS